MDLAETPTTGFRRHPWEVVRARFFSAQLLGVVGDRAGASILDVGAGDGFFASVLKAQSPAVAITCFDPGYEQTERPLAVDRRSGIEVTATEPAGVFDAITLLDVLEHVEDDEGFLQPLIRARLRPGGCVLFSVPAWPRLFSDHDRTLRHFRRYTPRAASALLGRAGLDVVRHGGLFHSLLPVRMAQVAAERFRRRSAAAAPPPLEWRGGSVTGKAVERWLELDAALSRLTSQRGIALPGLTWWAVCRKP